MKACWFDAFGAAQDVLQQGDWPTPEPGPGEVAGAAPYHRGEPLRCEKNAPGDFLTCWKPGR
jgi:hypothetical protein